MTESQSDTDGRDQTNKELKKARMRKKAREIAAEIDEFEDEYSDVMTVDGQHSWYQAYSEIRKIGRGRT